MSDAPLLKIEHLEVRYGDLIGVADVSLEVPRGSVVALLGSNGAGKTTTLNAIAGIARVSAGRVTFAGEDLAGQPAYAIVRKGLALSPEGWRLFAQQSVENNLLLDEPSLGLAPAIVDTMYDCFAALHKEGQTILLAEQSVDLALEAADHAYVLQVGRTVLEGPAKTMAGNADVQRIYLGVE
jgi:branched-chain amino acid transport system ATP-binding protein